VKYLYLIFLSFFLISCSNGSKEVYWCGDHACINKKERKIYFAETMIVEVRKLDKEFELNKIEKDQILKAIKLKDKKYTKKIKKNDDDSYIKAGELSIKKTKKSKKQKIKKPTKKKSKKWFFKKEVIDKSTYGESALSKFNDLAKKISKRNELRDYPDINNIEIKNND
jgi:hypothetical protein